MKSWVFEEINKNDIPRKTDLEKNRRNINYNIKTAKKGFIITNPKTHKK